VSQPSVELAHLLVSHICWSNNVPIAWKFLDKALSLKLAPPSLVLALLSTRLLHFSPPPFFPFSSLFVGLCRSHGETYFRFPIPNCYEVGKFSVGFSLKFTLVDRLIWSLMDLL